MSRPRNWPERRTRSEPQSVFTQLQQAVRPVSCRHARIYDVPRVAPPPPSHVPSFSPVRNPHVCGMGHALIPNELHERGLPGRHRRRDRHSQVRLGLAPTLRPTGLLRVLPRLRHSALRLHGGSLEGGQFCTSVEYLRNFTMLFLGRCSYSASLSVQRLRQVKPCMLPRLRVVAAARVNSCSPRASVRPRTVSCEAGRRRCEAGRADSASAAEPAAAGAFGALGADSEQ